MTISIFLESIVRDFMFRRGKNFGIRNLIRGARDNMLTMLAMIGSIIAIIIMIAACTWVDTISIAMAIETNIIGGTVILYCG